MQIEHPYLMFLGDAPDTLAAKMATGIVDWRRDWCLGQLRLDGCNADVGVPDMGVRDAADAGCKTMVVGVVNAGGVLPDHWTNTIVEALEAGLDVATGLHRRLSSFPRIAAAAELHGRALHDVRFTDESFPTGKGHKRTGRRIITVGTDCSCGKKYAALALERDMRARGMNADFRATGQTGVLISGRGVAIDAVVADFISGAAEWLSPDNTPDHWDVVEGQGSIFHPSFAGVTTGLLHGSQPDAFVVCHEPTRTRMRGVDYPLPSIEQVIDRVVELGRLTNPAIQCTGIAINTSALDEDAAHACLEDAATRHGVPAVDPMRFDMEAVVDEIQSRFG